MKARGACTAEAVRQAKVSSDAVDLDGVDAAVRIDGGWGFSGTVATASHDRAFVCRYVNDQAHVTLGS